MYNQSMTKLQTNTRNGKTYAKIKDLKLWSKNPRDIKPQALKQLMTDIRKAEQFTEDGMFKPLIVMADGTVIGGNQRLKALRKMGRAEVWISIIDTLDESKAFEIAIEDNMAYGYYEEDQLFDVIEELDVDQEFLDTHHIEVENDVTIAEMRDNILPDPEVTEDIPPEPEAKTYSKPGEVYQLGDHRVMCGDSTKQSDVDRLMRGEKASMIFTDPPYNVNYKGAGKKTSRTILNDKMGSQEFYEFLLDAFATMRSILKPNAPLYTCFSQTTHTEFLAALNDNDFHVKSQIIWAKPNATMGWQEYRHQYEPIFFAYANAHIRPNFYGDRRNTSLWKFEDQMTDEQKINLAQEIISAHNESTDVWEIGRDSDYDHPTQKPVKLPARAIMNSSRKNEIVIDLFAGSGSTMIAAEQLKRKCYMMEMDEAFVDVIRRRYWKFINGTEDGWRTGTPAIKP